MTARTNGPACCSDRDPRSTAEEQMENLMLRLIVEVIANNRFVESRSYQTILITFLKLDHKFVDKGTSIEIIILNFSKTFSFESYKKQE